LLLDDRKVSCAKLSWPSRTERCGRISYTNWQKSQSALCIVSSAFQFHSNRFSLFSLGYNKELTVIIYTMGQHVA